MTEAAPRFSTSPQLTDERSSAFADRYEANFPGLLFDSPADRIVRVTMSGPGLNSADASMHSSLTTIWPVLDNDPDVDVMMIRGAGTGFSGGGHLDLVEAMAQDYEERSRVALEAENLVRNLLDTRKPIVSTMHGPAVGAGLVAGLLADYSIAAKDAKILDGHVKLGVTAGDHAVLIWPLLIGIAKTKRYLLTGEPITGEKAEEMGMIAEAVTADKLEERGIEVARLLAHGSQPAIRGTKHALNELIKAIGWNAFESSLRQEMLDFTGPDLTEGIDALRQKRKPIFPSTYKPE